MSSPLASDPRHQWARLFVLPDQPGLPLKDRLRLALVRPILEGRLPPDAAMPSSRELSRLLAVSRNTVTTVYEQLVNEGFLQARPRSGVFVARDSRLAGVDQVPAVPMAGPDGSAPDWAARVLRSLTDRHTLTKPQQWREYPYPFVYGMHDPALFPTEGFRECCMRSLARAQMPQWTPDFETDDVPDLIEQIRLRLLPRRGVFALREEILVTVGAQQAFYLLADALLDSAQRLGFEEPGHPHARNTFSLRRPRWVPVAVDGEGVVVDGLPPMDYLFVTPSHQSPTTVTLSLQRRERLLRRAEQDDFVIIEDDYEAENLYQGAPMPALKSLDRSGRVIYVGSLSKSLSPALRLGYIVAPRALIEELRVLRHAMVRHPSAFLQHTYALFLSLGHHEAHARRVNQAMQERVAQAAQALSRHMPDFAFELPQGGASMWVRAPQWLDADALAEEARRHGVLIEAGSAFFATPLQPCPCFRLRLSSIAAERIDAGIAALSLAVDALAQSLGVQRAMAAHPGQRQGPHQPA